METFLRCRTVIVLLVVIKGTCIKGEGHMDVRKAFKNTWAAVLTTFIDIRKINIGTPNEKLSNVAANHAANNACDVYNKITENEALKRPVREKPFPVIRLDDVAVFFKNFECSILASYDPDVTKDKFAEELWELVKVRALCPKISTQLEIGACLFLHNGKARVSVVILMTSACTLLLMNNEKKVALMLAAHRDQVMDSLPKLSQELSEWNCGGIRFRSAFVENIGNSGLDGTLIIAFGHLEIHGKTVDWVCEQPGFTHFFIHMLAMFHANSDAVYGIDVRKRDSISKIIEVSDFQDDDLLVCFILKPKVITSQSQAQPKTEDNPTSPVSLTSLKTAPGSAATNVEVQTKQKTDSPAQGVVSLLELPVPNLDQQQQPLTPIVIKDPFLELLERKPRG